MRFCQLVTDTTIYIHTYTYAVLISWFPKNAVFICRFTGFENTACPDMRAAKYVPFLTIGNNEDQNGWRMKRAIECSKAIYAHRVRGCRLHGEAMRLYSVESWGNTRPDVLISDKFHWASISRAQTHRTKKVADYLDNSLRLDCAYCFFVCGPTIARLINLPETPETSIMASAMNLQANKLDSYLNHHYYEPPDWLTEIPATFVRNTVDSLV